jgi:diguanylate cyclase (GGDEF)-like protein
LQAEFAYQAAHDQLTGLANRFVLDERLGSLPHDQPYALLLIDLDGLKEINDSLGQPTGDELLVAIGRRLTSLAPPGSTLVRLGGDEFAVLLPATGQQTAIALGTAVCDELRLPHPSAVGELTISASVGVTARAQAARGPGEVLREADLALYAAKAAGKDRVAGRPRPGLRGDGRGGGSGARCPAPPQNLATGFDRSDPFGIVPGSTAHSAINRDSRLIRRTYLNLAVEQCSPETAQLAFDPSSPTGGTVAIP